MKTIKAFFKGEPFELNNPNKKEIVQAMLLYLNSLGDPVFLVSGEEWHTPQNDINKVDVLEVAYWFVRLCETDAEEQGEEFGIYENGLEVFAE